MLKPVDVAVLGNENGDFFKIVEEIDPDIKNFYDFTVDSFKLVNYECNKKKYDIPVAE